MKKTNFELDRMLQRVSPLLERKGVVGMTAARNTRVISEAIKEYSMVKADLIKKFGQETEEGFSIGPGLPKFDEFIESLTPYGEVSQEIDVMTMPIEKAMDELTGTEMLMLDWMFDDDDLR